jgi:hypothetical protein
MKFLLVALCVFAAVVIGLACKQTRYTADQLPEKHLRWGSGGGVVGKEKSHILLENGQIFETDIMGKTTETKKVSGKKAKALFKTASTAGIAKMAFDHPGNLYYFLEWQEGDMVSRMVWGDKNLPVDKSVEALYAELNALLKD